MTASSSLRIPSYRHQKSRNLAVVRLDGKDRYLGPYDSPASRELYHRLVHEWLAGKQAPQTPDDPGPTVNELILRYWDGHVTSYYVKDNRPTSEQDNIRQALRFVRLLYEHASAQDFGPLALKAVREAMIQAGRCRSLVNKDVHRIRAMFRWAVENELIPVQVHQALCAVKALPKGRSAARETEPVRPVAEEVIEATLPHLSSQVAAMVRLQLLTGARPGEVAALRPMDLDRSDAACWSYRPTGHKSEHHGKDRHILIGPRAQGLLHPFLEGRAPNAFCFSPAEAEAERNARKRAARRSKITPSQRRRAVQANPAGRSGDRYSVTTYRRAIERACDRAFAHPTLSKLPRAKLTPEQLSELKRWKAAHRWHPHQLRHNAGTDLRREFGVELAKVILGHGDIKTTEIYAERDLASAKAVVIQVG